jgi:enoyl-CoA hydratase/carnithine racemase
MRPRATADPTMTLHMPDPTAAPLLREDRGPVAVLTLNRPSARNSLSEPLIAALHGALDAIAHDPTVRAVVLAARGPAFCAGHDLKELTARRAEPDGGRGYFQTLMTACSAAMQAIVTLPKPVIAAVQGVATAAGCQLVASCDLAVASEQASFATPGVDIGLFCSTPMVALSRNVPRKQAMEMLMTGEPIGAARAREIGLVNRVVPAGTELAAAIDLAELIARKSAATLRLGKQAYHRQADMSLVDAYAFACEVMTENMMLADAREGIGAFIEKRAPVWRDA